MITNNTAIVIIVENDFLKKEISIIFYIFEN